MESFLKSIGKERHLDAFNENEITLDLLKTISRENLEKTLTLLNLNVGTFITIIDAVEALKIKGKWILLCLNAKEIIFRFLLFVPLIYYFYIASRR